MKVVQADEEALARVLDSGRESGISHSPSLRTGRADLPHPALQSVVGPARGVMNDQSVAAEHTSRDRRPGRLGYPSHHHEPALGPALSAPSTSNRVPIRHSPKALGGGIDAAVRPGSSTSLRSLRSLAITPLPRCRVGGGALARWPPSAAQTARTVFPYAAFTKTPTETRTRGKNQVDPLRVRQVGRGDQYPRTMRYGDFAERTDPPHRLRTGRSPPVAPHHA